MRVLRWFFRILDELKPGFVDDILRHLGAVWDLFGPFSPFLAAAAVVTLAVLGYRLQTRLLLRHLPAMSERARLEAVTLPVLAAVSRPRRFQRFRRTAQQTFVRIDDQGISVERSTGTTTVEWSNVTQWSRSGLAAWQLRLSDGDTAIEFTDRDRLESEDLERIDDRLALYVSALPRTTLRDATSRAFDGIKARINRMSPKRIERISRLVKPRPSPTAHPTHRDASESPREPVPPQP